MALLQQIRKHKYDAKPKNYWGPVKYFGVDIERWQHPGSIANYILNYIKHTHTFGCQFIAPMGHGKTTTATVIAHHIHTKRPEFKTVWAEASDFRHLKRFLNDLVKEPTIIIFDDITSALKQMSDRDVEKNFEDLTKIRWITDPKQGEIPIIIFVNYHYSKNLEKAFRAVLGMTVFLSFGSEEYTNIDTILPKRTHGRRNLEYFSKIADRMFTRHEFELPHSNGQIIKYKTDEPCRACCAVMGKESQIIVTSVKDQCPKCSKSIYRKYAEPWQVIERVEKAYPTRGKKALRLALMKRGFYPFDPALQTVVDFVENRLLPQFSIDWEEMKKALISDYYKRKPNANTRIYHKRKNEEEVLEGLEKTARVVELTKSKSTTDESLT